MMTNDYVRQVLSELAPYLRDDQKVKFRINMVYCPYNGEQDVYPCITTDKTDNYIEFYVKMTKEIRDIVNHGGRA